MTDRKATEKPRASAKSNFEGGFLAAQSANHDQLHQGLHAQEFFYYSWA
jgi:hypothetical protein